MENIDPYLTSTGFPVGDLKVQKPISYLSEKEMKYAAYLIMASWAGFPMLVDQTSREGLSIHEFLYAFFNTFSKEDLIPSLSVEPRTPLFYFIEYSIQFFFNSGNYLSFGDTKFIPRCSKEEIREIVKGKPILEELLEKCIESIYDLTNPQVRQQGFAPNGITNYYEPVDFTLEEAQGIDNILQSVGVHVENTKIIRHNDKYEVLIASIDEDPIGKNIGIYKDKPVFVTKGRFSKYLKVIVEHLKNAIVYAANPKQVEMLEQLIQHYETGSIEKHMKFSEIWVTDVDPVIEMYHGFIESYHDPKGVRCSYEGMVACVDKKESECLHNFVTQSSKILPLLPYPKEYERGTFNPPSYNALNILSMCSDGMPIGINIPNYDSIRMSVGFKNVTLNNVMNGVPPSPKAASMIHPSARELFTKLSEEIMSLSVAAHELYGHGTGKLFKKADVEGKQIPDLLFPGQFVRTYWPEGISYDMGFGSLSQAFEECRAETTSLYLTFFDEVLDIFDVPKDTQHRKDYALVSVYHMLLSSLRSMYCYSPEARQWKQAHASARFAILRALIIWGEGSVKVTKYDDDRIELFVDPNNLEGVKNGLKILLTHLNYYKSTYQPDQAREFFSALTSFDAFWLDVKRISDKEPKRRAVYCGAVVEKTQNDIKVVPFTNETPTIFDAVMSIVSNIKVANE